MEEPCISIAARLGGGGINLGNPTVQKTPVKKALFREFMENFHLFFEPQGSLSLGVEYYIFQLWQDVNVWDSIVG